MLLKYKKGKDIFAKYICDITSELDKLANLNSNHYYLFQHYILLDKDNPDCLPIRLPDDTVGEIWLKDNVISKIVIDTDYVVKTYPSNINEEMNKYIGLKIENL